MTERLELKGFEFSTKTAAFLSLMADPAFQQRFQDDPGGTAAREMQLNVPHGRISEANKVLNLLLEDRAFGSWVDQFQQSIAARYPRLNRCSTIDDTASEAANAAKEIQQEFSAGVARHLPQSLLGGIDPEKIVTNGHIVADEDDIFLFLLVFVVIIPVLGVTMSALLSRNTIRLIINQFETIRQTLEQEA